jgi:hypothetical protein
MKTKTATPKSSRKRDKSDGSSVAAQRQRLFDSLLQAGPEGITTIYARECLDIIAPAPRIFELRHNEGRNIQTVRTSDINAQGCKHHVARYVLLPGKYKGAA